MHMHSENFKFDFKLILCCCWVWIVRIRAWNKSSSCACRMFREKSCVAEQEEPSVAFVISTFLRLLASRWICLLRCKNCRGDSTNSINRKYLSPNYRLSWFTILQPHDRYQQSTLPLLPGATCRFAVTFQDQNCCNRADLVYAGIGLGCTSILGASLASHTLRSVACEIYIYIIGRQLHACV